MIELTLPALSQWLGAWLFPLFRLSAFFLVAPVFGMQLVPARIRLGLALLVTALLVPLLPAVPAVDPLSPAAMLLIAQQLLIGLGLGFAMQLFFQVFVMGAQLMAMGMMMLSPMIISLPFKIMLFVLVDGWALIIGSLASSFAL